jgi:lipopolysaccharide transport system ATP-binding protein
MSDTVIAVENVSKRYLVGHQSGSRQPYTALRDSLARGTRNFIRKAGDFLAGRQILQGDEIEEFWALKDVSFQVKRGEVLGLVGRNGAGKSTLLKILSRITEPSAGRVAIKGRVASLLEVGTGFHPELTGRENIYLNGAILGMSRAEVRRKFDEIVAFADVEKFLDTPVKRFSSGMYVRLAFAVAAHLEPEILLVDEVLAVGDAEFQQKCLGRMRSVTSQEGRTVLFVSHNMTAINSLCHRAILMDHGGVVAIGPAQEISELYAASGRRNEERCRSWTYREAPGDERFKIARIAVVSDANEAIAPIATNTAFNVEADYWNLVDDAKIILELIVRASDGTPVFHSYSSESDEKAGRPHRIGLYRSSCRVPGNLLNSGRYDIEMYFSHGRADQEFGLVNTISIVVHDLEERGNLTYYGRFIGHVHPMLSWRSRMIETAPNKSPELT